MDKNLLLLSAKLLDTASDEFSNHGCNDLSKDVQALITPEILKDIKKWLDDYDIQYVPDWLLMNYLRDKLKEEAKA